MRIGMFEPTQTQIDDKVQELLAEKLKDDDVLVEALINCLPQVRTFYKDNDYGFDLKEAIDKHVINWLELESKARDALIAEVGYTVRTDVDDYKFVYHDTRY